jgi:hypothetical protein
VEFSVFPNCLKPPSESEIGFADTAKQMRSELFSIALLGQVKIKRGGPCKKEHVLEVAVIVALQLAESDIVGVHHEEMDMFEETFTDPHLAHHAGNFCSKDAKLPNHRIYDYGGAQKLSFERPFADIQPHDLCQIPLRHGSDRASSRTTSLNCQSSQLVEVLHQESRRQSTIDLKLLEQPARARSTTSDEKSVPRICIFQPASCFSRSIIARLYASCLVGGGGRPETQNPGIAAIFPQLGQ